MGCAPNLEPEILLKDHGSGSPRPVPWCLISVCRRAQNLWVISVLPTLWAALQAVMASVLSSRTSRTRKNNAVSSLVSNHTRPDRAFWGTSDEPMRAGTESLMVKAGWNPTQ